MQKVADSHSFARAPRLRELFLYIAGQALAGHLEELSEQQIGIRVFGRPEAYNPAEDNIVRVSARQLRMKLKEYFETEGRDLNMTIDIPKGGYLPVFEMRSVISELVPIIPTAVGESTPVGGGRQRGLWLAVVALGGICLVLLALLLRPKAAVPGDPKGIWTEMFGTSNGRIMFVLTDSALMVTSPLMKGPPGLEQYVSGDYLQEVEKQLDSATAKEIGRNLRPRRITSIADVMILTRLVQSHPELARRIEVRHAKDMHARDFSNGSFIMTGGPRSNPWANLFESGLNFHFSGGSVIKRKPTPQRIRRLRPIQQGTPVVPHLFRQEHWRGPSCGTHSRAGIRRHRRRRRFPAPSHRASGNPRDPRPRRTPTFSFFRTFARNHHARRHCPGYQDRRCTISLVFNRFRCGPTGLTQ